MNKKGLLAAAVATALSTGLVATKLTGVLAAETQPKETSTKAAEQPISKAAEQDLIKVSKDAAMTMRSLRGSRFAIFNGQPDEAKRDVDAAVTEIANTVKDAEKYAVDVKAKVQDDWYVPYDASLTVADTFVPTEEKMKHIAKANEHLHKGEKKQALEVLKVGNVDVAFATSLMPSKFAQKHIDDAAKLLDEGKYYEANLELKAVEDAVVIETFGIDETPQGKEPSQGKEATQAKH